MSTLSTVLHTRSDDDLPFARRMACGIDQQICNDLFNLLKVPGMAADRVYVLSIRDTVFLI